MNVLMLALQAPPQLSPLDSYLTYISNQTRPLSGTDPMRPHPCPACRGYSLERQWCAVCNHTGQVAGSTIAMTPTFG